VENMKRQRTQRGFGARLRMAALVLTAAAAVVGSGLAPSATAAVPRPADTASSGGTACSASGTGTTCTGTYSTDPATDTAWDWWINGGTGGGDASTGTTNGIGGTIPQTPSVTVDQTSNLTNQMVTVSWKNFAPTFNQDGSWPAWANQYDPTPGNSVNVVDVFQCKGTDAATMTGDDCDTLFAGGTSSNGEEPTALESYTQGGTSTVFGDCQSVPSTDTTCGTGTTPFQVQTAVQNSFLGCNDTTACSIVVVPDWGGNYEQGASCTDHSQDLSISGGNLAANGPGVVSDPCAWNDRIVVPISFAPTPAQYCPSNNYSFNSEGSAFLEKAMQQWLPGWCVDKQSPLDFGYNSGVNEYEARSSFLAGSGALTSSTDVALVTDPASSAQTAASARKFTYAPISNTAISVAYYVDDQATDQPITNLKLNARLLAKLLTESYSLVFNNCGSGTPTPSENCDPGVVGNPQTIFADPEFQQLNPEYTPTDFQLGTANAGEFLPVVMAGDSDLTYELTRWIAADPDARAFLEGKPDPWGMHVNTYYEKSQTYPVSTFQVLDPGFSVTPSQFYAQNLTYDASMQVAWNPVTGLDNVATHLADWQTSGESFTPSCTIVSGSPCDTGPGTGSFINPADPPQQFGVRALFAIMDSGTAAAFRFPTAQLVNAAGNAVAPTTDSMNAAVASMKTNPDGITQYQDFSNTSPNAYPLTEVQYAMVPTCGISATKASAISRFLQNVGTTAQYYGVNPGELPPFGGYLALNDAQQKQDVTAAGAVQSLSCTSPPPDTTVSGQKTSSTGGSGNNAPGSAGNGLATTPSNPLSGSPFATGRTTAAASASATPTVVGLGEKAADSGGDVKYILPAALAAGGLLAIGGPLAYGFGTTGGLRRPRLRRRTGSRSPGAAPPTENTGGGRGDLDG